MPGRNGKIATSFSPRRFAWKIIDLYHRRQLPPSIFRLKKNSYRCCHSYRKYQLLNSGIFRSGILRIQSVSVVGITGLNGVGKTNLVDAIITSAIPKSYFRPGKATMCSAIPSVSASRGIFDTETIVCKWKEGKKSIEHDGVSYEKITEHIGQIHARS